MPIIDTFLKLMLERRAEKLVLPSDQTPFLLRQGEIIELSMPALREDMLLRISHEMIGDAAEDEGTFKDKEGAEFAYRIQTGNPEWRIEIQTLDSTLRDQSPAIDLPVEAEPALQATRETPNSGVSGSPYLRAYSGRPDPELVAWLDQALQQNASDLFLSSDKSPRARVNGKIAALGANAPTADQILGLIPDEPTRSELEKAGNVDFSACWEMADGPHRIRINVFKHIDGVAAALRPIRRHVPQLAELFLPSDLHQLATFPDGLVLVTGVAGSGKSTTLAALVDHLNRTRPRHIITIEDPVEYEHREIQCLIHQREVGRNVESFATGLRAALRESPDVILLGELRDLETITAALTAAETGHLILATLHAGSASTAVNRIVDVFPGHQQTHIRMQLALSLRAVVSQRLVPSRSGGLVPAVEKLLVTPAVANGIREGHDHFMRNAMLSGSEDGMITLERSLATLVRERLIDRETAIRHATDPELLLRLLEN